MSRIPSSILSLLCLLGPASLALSSPTYTVTVLGPPGVDSSASGIASAQQVSPSDGDGHAFLFRAGTQLDLGTSRRTESIACSIDASGDAVGQLADAEGPTHLFLYCTGITSEIAELLTSPFPARRSGSPGAAKVGGIHPNYETNAVGHCTGMAESDLPHLCIR